MKKDIFQLFAESDEQEICAQLRSFPAHASLRNDNGQTPLHYAAYRGLREVIVLLSKLRGDIDARDAFNRTPLYLAVEQGMESAAEELLVLGANPNIKTTPDGDLAETALHAAARFGRLRLIELLLAHGADVLLQDGLGRTPAKVAEVMEHTKVAQYIRDFVREHRNRSTLSIS